MLDLLHRLFPGFRTAKRVLASIRPPHFRLLSSLFSSPPPPLEDLAPSEIETIDRCSRAYYERPEQRDYWRNTPFSYPELSGWLLWRFGLLLCGLSLRPGDRILDFGCGTGWTSMMMARMGAEVTGMDVAPAALEMAREAASCSMTESDLKRLRFEPCSDGRIPATDEFFDFVVVFEAFHHFPNPKTLLREFYRVLTPHGQLGFAEPGIGHSNTVESKAEMNYGILERDLDLEQFYRSGIAAGFREMEIFVQGVHPQTLTLPMKRARRYIQGMSWLLPDDFIRSAILSGPVGVFRKGPYRITSLHPGSHQAGIRPVVHSISIAAGSTFRIDVSVTNPTDTVWLKEGRNSIGCVRLGAHLLDANANIQEQDYGRADLPSDLQQDQSTSITISLRAPATPGRYTLRLDMVNEGICWFGQTGAETADVALEVTS